MPFAKRSMVSRQRDPALHLDANGDLSQAFRDRMRRQPPPSDEPGDALLAARVAALEDGLAVACAAIAHLKGLAESTSVAPTAASAPAPAPLSSSATSTAACMGYMRYCPSKEMTFLRLSSVGCTSA